jgi:hypothetical protein
MHAYIRFCREIKSMPKLVFNEQMTSLNVNLKPNESLTLKKFNPPISKIMVLSVVKMEITGFNEIFKVHLLGIVKKAFCEVKNAI